MTRAKDISKIITAPVFGGLTYPTTDGSANQFMKTDGSGNLTFASVAQENTTINNNADNRIITGSGTTNTLEGEANLTFDGTTLGLTGNLTVTGTTSLTAQTDTGVVKFRTATAPTFDQNSYIYGESGFGMNIESSAIKFNVGSSRTERMRIDSNGKLLVNTTSGTGTVSITGTGTDLNSTVLKINNTSSATFVHAQQNLAPNLTANQTVIDFVGKALSTKNSGYIGYTWVGNGSNSNKLTFGHYGNDYLMNLTADGKLGIGSSNPDSGRKLHIEGNDTTVGITLKDTAGTQFAILSDDNVFKIKSDSSGSELMRIVGSTGFVGIGSSSPDSPLTVQPTAQGVGTNLVQNWLYNKATNGQEFDLKLNQVVTPNLVKHSFTLRNNGTSYADNLVLDRGKVGIGTISPSANLSVEGTLAVRTSSSQAFNDSNNANNLTMNDSKAHFNLDGADKDFQVSSDTVTHALFLQGSDGNIGIGTSNPTHPLTIAAAHGIVQQGVRIFTARFNIVSTNSISFDINCANEGGSGQSFLVFAGYNHYYISAYGTHFAAFLSARGTNITNVLSLGNQTSGNAGSWAFSKPTSTVLRIIKNPGTYGGGGAGFVYVVFSSSM